MCPLGIVVVADIRLQLIRNRQMVHLVHPLKERRRQIVVPARKHHLHLRVGLHRVRQVRHHVGRRLQTAGPLAAHPEPACRKSHVKSGFAIRTRNVCLLIAVLQILTQIAVDRRRIRRRNRIALRIVLRLLRSADPCPAPYNAYPAARWSCPRPVPGPSRTSRRPSRRFAFSSSATGSPVYACSFSATACLRAAGSSLPSSSACI